MEGEGRKRWRLGRGAVIGIAVVALVGGGAGVAVAADSGWFGTARPVGASKSTTSEPQQQQQSSSPDPVASGAHAAPEPVSPPKPPKPSNSAKPPKPAAICSPAPKPALPRPRDRYVPNHRIPFNGRQVVSVCIAPVRSDVPAKVLTFNQAAAVIDAISKLKLTTTNQPCTKEFRGTFQVVVQAANGTYVFNGEGHGCGYVTYKGNTYTGGRAIFSLIAQYMRS